ncbi:MAG: Fatty acid metabolism regulator protein [Pseudomonadota bacterium]|jgi:AcrR family transcriptional regulator
MPETFARPPRWERRKERRPSELVAAALGLFVERGYAATRLDEVAARAGVSKGTLYLYFESKEDLFKAVVREHIVPVLEASHRALENPNASSEQLVRRFFQDWWERFGATELSGIAKLVIAEAGNFPEVARFFRLEVIEPNNAAFGAMIRRGIARGEFRPIDPLVATQLCLAPMVLKAIWTRSFDEHCPAGSRIDPGDFVEQHTEFVLAALRAQPGPGAPR